MTRQIALGAVIAFAVTVLVLSVWEPKAPAPAAPVAPPPAAAAVAPARGLDPMTFRQNLKPAAMRPEALGRTIRQAPAALLMGDDAGAPLP